MTNLPVQVLLDIAFLFGAMFATAAVYVTASEMKRKLFRGR